MTNLEKINQILFRELKGSKYWNSKHRLWRYCKAEYNTQIAYWMSIQMLHEIQWLEGANVITKKIVNEIFKQEFIEFLKKEKVLDIATRIICSQEAREWRTDVIGHNFTCDNLDDFIDFYNPRFYMVRAWQWSRISGVNGYDLNQKWIGEIEKILKKEYKF